MRLLLDTHIVLAMVDHALDSRYPQWAPMLEDPAVQLNVSVASLWEIAIKFRIGKLDSRIAPELIDDYLRTLGVVVLPVAARHATLPLASDIPIRDPFDRLLVAVAQSEGLRFITADPALVSHPVTFG